MKQHYRQGLMILVAFVTLLAVLMFDFSSIKAQKDRPVPEKIQEVQYADVSVISVMPDQYEARVSSYGTARPHYELMLTAQVSGQVEELNTKFEPGERINKDTLLIQLEDSDYRAKVASAKNDLASAQLALLEEKRQVIQAQEEWKASGFSGEPNSELVLRQPQLNVAKTTVNQAKVALNSALKDLNRTRITAPFSALVVNRKVSLGSYVQIGTEIASLYSTEYVEVSVDLSAHDWNSLPDESILNVGNWLVDLYSIETGQNWMGRVLRVEQHLDDSTRQRSLIVAVDQPLDLSPALYPGTFLKVDIKGRLVDGLWKLPSSALSQRGEIWYVTKDNTLISFATETVFSDNQAIYIEAPDNLKKEVQRILTHPLSSYLQGMVVNPLEKLNPYE